MEIDPALEAKMIAMGAKRVYHGRSIPGAIARKAKGKPKMPTKFVEPGFSTGFNYVELTLALKLEPVSNGGTFKKWLIGQAAKHRRAFFAAAIPHLREMLFLIEAAQRGCKVYCTITRLGRDMDNDGLSSASKWLRDSAAMLCGVDDSSKGPIQWSYQQSRRAYSGAVVRLSLEP